MHLMSLSLLLDVKQLRDDQVVDYLQVSLEQSTYLGPDE